MLPWLILLVLPRGPNNKLVAETVDPPLSSLPVPVRYIVEEQLFDEQQQSMNDRVCLLNPTTGK